MVRNRNAPPADVCSAAKPAAGFGYILLPAVLIVFSVLLGAVVYALGMRAENFQWNTFRTGAMLFIGVVAAALAGTVVVTLAVRVIAFISPRSLQVVSEKRRLNQSRKKAVSAIRRRHQLQEEHARLTARMQAAYLFEKESARIADSQAVRELQKAVQSSMVRSCEVVFDHLNRTVEEYQRVVDEIRSSSLTDGEKSELLDQLTRQLDVPGEAHRHRSAQRMMEDAIWRVRFRKARLLSRRNPVTARQYLQTLRKSGTSHRMLVQIDALMKELQ